MRSWWQFGEGYGQSGRDLADYQIECAFCGERGNWEIANHLEKKKPNSEKVLNFDTLKCGSCASYVLVFWSASEGYGHSGLHNYKVLPYPLKTSSAPEHWPVAVQKGWLEARKSLEVENWNSASVMARTALQTALREKGAEGANLYQEIESLGRDGLIPPLMVEWSHEVRELGNDSTHLDPDDEGTESEDAEDVVNFLDYMLEYLYDLPLKIERFRNRNSE